MDTLGPKAALVAAVESLNRDLSEGSFRPGHPGLISWLGDTPVDAETATQNLLDRLKDIGITLSVQYDPTQVNSDALAAAYLRRKGLDG